MKILSLILPDFFKIKAREILNKIIRKNKAAKMLWGYKDATGKWCKQTRISDSVCIIHPEKVFVGDNVFVWHYTILDGTGGLYIDEGCQIGAWVGIFTHSSHIAIRLYGSHYQDIPEKEKKGYVISPVRIGKYTGIGAKAIILPGVTIGQGVMICAGALVNRNIKDFEIVSGNPMQVVGDSRKIDQKYLKDPQINGWYHEWQL